MMRIQSDMRAIQSDAEDRRSHRTQDCIYMLFSYKWQEYQDHLYHCCLKWMNGNHSYAEEALSRSALKAWNKVKDEKYIVTNFKAWLTKLTRNLCMDIHRENNRRIRKCESIEAMTEAEGDKLESLGENPILAVSHLELDFLVKNAIEKLSPKLREVFIPYYYQDRAYREIAEEIGISYANARKRMSQARGILKEELRCYVKEDDIADSFPPKRGQSG